MKIEAVNAKSILDSRKEKTILVSIKTNVGTFSASSPTGNQQENLRKNLTKKALRKILKQ